MPRDNARRYQRGNEAAVSIGKAVKSISYPRLSARYPRRGAREQCAKDYRSLAFPLKVARDGTS